MMVQILNEVRWRGCVDGVRTALLPHDLDKAARRQVPACASPGLRIGHGFSDVVNTSIIALDLHFDLHLNIQGLRCTCGEKSP